MRSDEGSFPRKERITINLSAAEWNEFLHYVRRHYRSVDEFFTEQALQCIAAERAAAGGGLN